MADEALREKLYQRLRVVRPAGVVAILRDGKERPISVKAGNSKGKWNKVIDLAIMLDAEAVEMQDVDGAIIELFPLTEREADSFADAHGERLEQLAMVRSEDPGVRAAEHIALLALDSADRQVGRFNDAMAMLLEQMRSAMEANTLMLNLAVQRLHAQEAELARLINDARSRGAGEPGGADDSMLNQLAAQVIARALPGGSSNGKEPFPPKGPVTSTNGKPNGHT